MNKTKIEWCDYTWNPIRGCKRGCYYCYAKVIHDRFNEEPFTEIKYHPDRMKDLLWLGKQKPSTVFIGSMSDIEYWPKDVTQHILDEIKKYDKHTFMFLSKNPKSYLGFKWPENSMQGLTIERCETIQDNYNITLLIGNCHRPFVSIEPLLGYVVFNEAILKMEKIIVGAMSGPGAVKPKPEWIHSIKKWVPEEKIFWKKNILTDLKWFEKVI